METGNNHTKYHIAILGANGGIGRQTVSQALKAGHKVTAILRTPEKLKIKHKNLIIVQGDVMKPDKLTENLKNVEVVVSALGTNSLKETTLFSQGVKKFAWCNEQSRS